MKIITAKLLILVTCCIIASASIADEKPTMILHSGKILTVDDVFSIHEAVAIGGDRIIAVGTNAEIKDLAATDTRIIDLGGKTVIPGLIDNHNHVIRATEYWMNEARLDGVNSRKEAVERLRRKSNTLPPGDWLMTLGGWTESQFSDSNADFTLEELDNIAPDRPAFIQSTYDHAFVNSAWFEAMGIPLVDMNAEENLSEASLASAAVRDSSGKVTGRLEGGMPMILKAIKRFPKVAESRQNEGIRAQLAHLNSLGITAVFDPAGGGLKQESYQRIRDYNAHTGLSVRIFHTLGLGVVPTTRAEADYLIGKIRNARPFQGDSTLDMFSIGESYYAPFHRDGRLRVVKAEPDAIEAGRDILTAAAKGSWTVQTHIIQPETIETFLDVVEEVNVQHPVRPLRWQITHADMIERSQIDRMRKLGMALQIRSYSVLDAEESVEMREQLGDAALKSPSLRMIHDSGIRWGLGTDGTKAAQINPFVTLWWAVTGRELGGRQVIDETLSREEALIAHTRSNAYLVFQEANLGSIQPGFLADLVVLDRDYMSIPLEEIRDLAPVATIVGGQTVYGEL